MVYTIKTGAKYADVDERVVSETGGRQGCQLGCILFNSSYALALKILHDRLRERGVMLRLPCAAGPCWSPPAADVAPLALGVNALDAAFTDDECLVLVSASAKLFRDSIDILLESLVTSFTSLRLEINGNPGK